MVEWVLNCVCFGSDVNSFAFSDVGEKCILVKFFFYTHLSQRETALDFL